MSVPSGRACRLCRRALRIVPYRNRGCAGGSSSRRAPAGRKACPTQSSRPVDRLATLAQTDEHGRRPDSRPYHSDHGRAARPRGSDHEPRRRTVRQRQGRSRGDGVSYGRAAGCPRSRARYGRGASGNAAGVREAAYGPEMAQADERQGPARTHDPRAQLPNARAGAAEAAYGRLTPSGLAQTFKGEPLLADLDFEAGSAVPSNRRAMRGPRRCALCHARRGGAGHGERG
jgi:hypothetical protein